MRHAMHSRRTLGGGVCPDRVGSRAQFSFAVLRESPSIYLFNKRKAQQSLIPGGFVEPCSLRCALRPSSRDAYLLRNRFYKNDLTVEVIASSSC